MENELSRPCNLETVGRNQNIEIKASDAECAELAKRFSIPEISALEASCTVQKMKSSEIGDYRLAVTMSAEISQRCVVTLDDIKETVREKFSVIFKEVEDVNELVQSDTDVEFEMDEDDIEPISSPEVDLGKYVAEYLSLSINPYPRRSEYEKDVLGYEILDEDQVSAEPKKENPFNVLKDLKHKT